MNISIIGIGRLGGALAIALAKKNYQIENLFCRRESLKISEFIEPKPNVLTNENYAEISSDVIFITTQDSEIEKTAEKLAESLNNESIVFHTSGSLSSEILQSLKAKNCKIGSLHPLISVSDWFLGAERFASSYFCVEGDGKAVETAEKIVADLGGKSFSIETEYKILYHASAVMASGHLVALIDAAVETLSECGLQKSEAKKILLPLIESTLGNLQIQETHEALTGTFARADTKTFEKHLKALNEKTSDDILELYLQLGLRSAHLAKRSGADKEKLKILSEKIWLAKKNLKC